MIKISDTDLLRVRNGDIVSTLAPVSRKVTELVAYGCFASPPDSVWTVLDDVENYATTMPSVRSSELLHRHEHGLRMRLIVATPFPLPDISSLYESIHSRGDGVWKREWTQVDKGLAPNSGSWTLVSMPEDHGHTLAV